MPSWLRRGETENVDRDADAERLQLLDRVA